MNLVVLGLLSWQNANAQATFIDFGPATSPPSPGPYDIYQTNMIDEGSDQGAFYYYTDNTGQPAGTTFLTGSNSTGYMVTNIFVQCLSTGFGADGIGNPTLKQPYKLTFYQVSGTTDPSGLGSNAATIAQIITAPGTVSTVGDWLSFSNFQVFLNPSTTNAFTWCRLSSGGGYMAMSLVTNNIGNGPATSPGPFANGLPCLIRSSGGSDSVSYGVGTTLNGIPLTNYDTVFSIGITTNIYLPAADFTYTTNAGAITITGYSGGVGTAAIPPTISGLPVTSIGNYAFESNPNLTGVTIPSGVTSIGYAAFAYTALSSVAIPGNLTNMGEFAFFCTSLSSLVIGNGVTNIAYDAFGGCSNLASVLIPGTVTSIDDWAFNGCAGLTNATIASGTTNIGYAAFAYCSNLTGVYFTGNAPAVGLVAFYDDPNVIIYYWPGATGWSSPFAGLPSMLWTVLTWPAPSAVGYGTPLSSGQLNATAALAGRFTYDPPAGTVLDAGNNSLSVVFNPTDLVNYSSLTDIVTLVVSPAPLTVTAANAGWAYGQPDPVFTGTITGIANGDDITATYTCSATPRSPVGLYSILPSLVDPGDRETNYVVTLIDGTLDVTNATALYTISTLAGQPGNFGAANQTGINAQFFAPSAVALDGATNLYVADTFNYSIRKVTPAGVVTTVAGIPGSSGSADGAGGTAQFWDPVAVAVDAAGNVYVADRHNNTIREVMPVGTNWMVRTLAGLPGYSGSMDGAGSIARFWYPSGVAVGGGSNLYVADSLNNTIRQLTLVGTNWIIGTLAGLASYPGSVDGIGSNARFDYPTGLAVDTAGNVYVADTGNNTIREITPAGVVTTIAGLAGNSGSADAVGAAARFASPEGVVLDSAGNLYVADTGNNTIRELTPEGVVTTLAGSPGVIGSADGPGSIARFNSPHGLAVDSASTLYIADTGNDTIRKGTPPVPTLTLSLLNGSFENPLVGPPGQSNSFEIESAQYVPGWSFYGASGIAANGSVYASVIPGTPDGNQFAFLASSLSEFGGMAEDFFTPIGGYFAFSFIARQEDTNSWQDLTLSVNVDGTTVSQFTPPASGWQLFQTGAIMLPAGSHYVFFVPEDASDNSSILVDSVKVYAGSGGNNDNFANRQPIFGLTNVVPGDNSMATREPGEPNFGYYPPQNSVWYTWTAPASGTVSLSLLSSFTNAGGALAVYAGDLLTDLTDLAYAEGGHYETDLSFPGLTGKTYQIEVADTAVGGGPFTLSLQSTPPLPPPPNDDIVNASFLVQSGSTVSYNVGATSESHDPFDYAGHTVWWLWYPETNGYVTIDTLGSDFNTVLGVYYYNGIYPTTQVGFDQESAGGGTSTVTFYAFANESYLVCVDGDPVGVSAVTSGNIVLNYNYAEPPPNDMRSNATEIVGLSVGQSQRLYGGNNGLATTEPGDPPFFFNDYEPEHSLWWTWTAPESMGVSIDTYGSTCSTYLAVCSGGITLVSSAGPGFNPGDDPAVVELGVVKGETLQIDVAGLDNIFPYSLPTRYGDVGNIVLYLSTFPLDNNDYFTNSVALSGDSAQVLGSNAGATNEQGEPHYTVAGQTPAYASVWYNWTAPYSGGVVIQVSGSVAEPILSAYTGNSLPSLVPLARDVSTFGVARVVFTAVAGVTYQVEVDDSDPNETGAGQGAFQLTLNLTPPPANDLFANATPIIGNYYTNSGSFLGASREPGEPTNDQPSAAQYPQTLWWTWTAPTNTGVSSSQVGLAADAVSFPPAFGVYQGDTVSNLTLVALTEQTNGMTTLASFTATPGVTYQIALAGQEQFPAGNIISPRWGDYRFRLNNRALALTILNATISSQPDTNGNFDFTADARIDNLGPATTAPLRVYVSDLSGVSVQGPDNGSATNGPAIFEGVWSASPAELPAQDNTTVQISGSLPAPIGGANDFLGTGYGAYAQLQEQHAGTNWFTVDQTLVLFGTWPTLGGNPGPGGGVIRLDPDYIGLTSFDPLKPPVVILGPAAILSGSSANFSGMAAYASGTNEYFTNSIWKSSFFTVTNGFFQAGNVISNTLVTLSVDYSYAGFPYTATLDVLVTNLPPPTLTLTSGANPSTYGSPVTFTAMIQTNGVPVTGINGEPVAFYNGAVQIGSGLLNADGQAAYTASVTQLDAGISSIVAVYGGDAAYPTCSNSPGLGQTVDPAMLTYTANIAGMTYGSTVPPLTGFVSGFAGTDTQSNATTGTLTFTTTATSSNSIGGYPINGSGLSANNGNYTFVQAVANASALIVNALPVILTGTRPYDGTTTIAAGILSVSNKVGGDNVAVASGIGALAKANVGTEAITSFGSLALGGAALGNYTLTGANGSVAVTSNATVLTVTNLSAENKVYDTTTNASLDTTNAGVVGAFNGDTVGLLTSNAIGYFTDKNVGANKPVTVLGLTLGGPSAANYTLSQPAPLSADITPATVTIASGVTANNKVYDGGTAATLTTNDVMFSGVFTNDTVSLDTNGYVAAFARASVGNNIPVTVANLTLSGISAGNYNLTPPTGLIADITTPSMQIVASLTNIVISWTTNSSVYVLNQTASLVPPVTWSPVTNGVAIVGANYTVGVNASSGDEYFELIAPP
jgi:hypothetical protein